MQTNRLVLTALVLAVMAPTGIQADDNRPPPRLIRQGLASGEYRVEATFPVGQVLQAWVIKSKPDDRSFIVYSTTDDIIIQGELIDPYGTELTRAHKLAYEIDKATEITEYVTEGNGNEAVLDIFLEPHCQYCKELWYKLKLYHNTVVIRWHPVAFLQDDSAGAIQYAFDKDKWPERFPAMMSQGIYQNVNPTQETQRLLQKNAIQMETLQMTSTPSGVITYKDGRKEAFQGLGILHTLSNML